MAIVSRNLQSTHGIKTRKLSGMFISYKFQVTVVTVASAAFLIQKFLHRQKIADVNPK